MIAINNLTFEIGARALYDEANWHIKPGEKIGLIGANGTGKTTLLKIIVGDYAPTRGTISMAKDIKIGYLNQDLLSYQSDKSILHVAMEAFERQNQLHTEIVTSHCCLLMLIGFNFDMWRLKILPPLYILWRLVIGMLVLAAMALHVLRFFLGMALTVALTCSRSHFCLRPQLLFFVANNSFGSKLICLLLLLASLLLAATC